MGSVLGNFRIGMEFKKPECSRAFFVPECDLRKISHSKKMDLEQESIHEGNATRALS
ncbi:hypothetical protein [Leptospira interrogans]|uniref:Transcriptional regulator n=1 Tax=Leptospira interrogans serovar Bataviae TaxID=312175 RepID=A0AAP9WKF4_LEPIR|nr:hypothetical protein [Leptospira interrogans]QOI51340.1 transcriptional regulator [Leptospira interrogans serovar Bataviae]